MKRKTILLFGILAIFSTFSIYSAQAHNPDPLPPHGGKIYQTEKYFLEMVSNPGGIRLYILNRHLKPLSPGEMEGTLLLKFPDGSQKISDLTKEGDYFKATLPSNPNHGFIAIATVRVNGKKQVGRFAF